MQLASTFLLCLKSESFAFVSPSDLFLISVILFTAKKARYPFIIPTCTACARRVCLLFAVRTYTMEAFLRRMQTADNESSDRMRGSVLHLEQMYNTAATSQPENDEQYLDVISAYNYFHSQILQKESVCSVPWQYV